MLISRITPQHEVILQNDIKGDTILVPSSQVSFFLIDLPTRGRSQAQKLAGFALEEELSQDIEQLHFAVIPHQGQWLVAVVEDKLMQEWLDELHKQGIKPKRLIPDVMAMGETVSILEEPHQILVKQLTHIKEDKENTAPTDDSKIQQATPTKNQAEQSDIVKPIKKFISCGISTPFLQPLLDYWEVSLDNLDCFYNDNYSQLLETNLKVDNTCINLLQGNYAENNSLLELAKPWLISFILASFISLSYAFSIWKSNQELESQIELSRQENVNLFRSTFPNIQRIVNPRSQAEARFREIQKDKKRSSSGLIQLLNLVIPTLINHNSVVLESIRYRKFNVVVQLNAPNVRTLEDLIQNLKRNSQLSINVDSLGQQNGKAKSRIQISKKL